jgi:hypothetical protein
MESEKKEFRRLYLWFIRQRAAEQERCLRQIESS